jgi:hypothetical protein
MEMRQILAALDGSSDSQHTSSAKILPTNVQKDAAKPKPIIEQYMQQVQADHDRTRSSTRSRATQLAERVVNRLRIVESDEVDTVTLDIPLLIRLFEYSKEEASSDAQLHTLAERIIELGKEHGTLSMQQYEAIMGTQKQLPDLTKESLVTESTSFESTIDAIVADIGRPIADMYSQLEKMANNYYDNRGNMEGFGNIAGGVGSRWYHQFYISDLQAELYHLVKYRPAHTGELKQVLSMNLVKFSDIARAVPSAVIDAANRMKSRELHAAALRWKRLHEQYVDLVERLTEQGESDDADTGPSDEQVRSQAIGSQNQQVEVIINAVLASLSPHIAGEIRNAICKSGNKLAALQNELAKRNIKP